MSAAFVERYDDLSSAAGFRFRFYCDRCPKSYEAAPRRSLVEKLLEKAAGKLPGAAREIADTAQEIRYTSPGQVADHALAIAIDQIKDRFAECEGCGKWVCRESCWNLARGRCETCSPNEDEVRVVREARAILDREERAQAERDAQYDRDAVASRVGVTCPACGQSGKSGKFCNGCGAPLP